MFEVKIRNPGECGDFRDAVLVHHTLHPVGERKTDPDLLFDAQPPQLGQFHRSAASYSLTYSPCSMRCAISSWQVTQNRAHGTASRRLGEIGSSHSRQTP